MVQRGVVAMLVVMSLGQGTVFAQRQGIRGQVFRSPDEPIPREKTRLSSESEPQFGLVCTVEVYPLTTSEQARHQEGNFFEVIGATPLATDKSKADGSFKLKLPPGEYSLFIRLPQGLYAGQIDENGRLGYVNVKKSTFTWTSIIVER
jgi:hypothetical protein